MASHRPSSAGGVPVRADTLHRHGVARKTLADVELATADYADWFNHKRLHTAIGGVPPAEFEAAYYVQIQPQPEAGPNN